MLACYKMPKPVWVSLPPARRETYDLAGNGLSVVEAIYLAPSGPVMTYSSSAWINGELNGRLVIDIFEALLINRAGTAGEWVGRIENWSQMIHSRALSRCLLRI